MQDIDLPHINYNRKPAVASMVGNKNEGGRALGNNLYSCAGIAYGVIEWTRGTGLRPYLDRLSDDAARVEFEREVFAEIKFGYPETGDGQVLFPFKRLFSIGYK
jgi:hypothetical protein